MEEETIYNIGLHKSVYLTDQPHTTTVVKRVPGGWLYQFWIIKNSEYSAPVFVPYSNEFKHG